jgi:predicted ribosomally synthesized peptide with nif11-like leader
MTQDQIQAFIDAVKANPELQQNLAASTSFEDAARIAREAGLGVSSEQLSQALEVGSVELSDAELEVVAGGGWGKLIKSLIDGGESCGHAVQKLTCKAIDAIEKVQ